MDAAAEVVPDILDQCGRGGVLGGRAEFGGMT